MSPNSPVLPRDWGLEVEAAVMVQQDAAGSLRVSLSFLYSPMNGGPRVLMQARAVMVQQDAARVRGVPESSYSSPMNGGSRGLIPKAR